MKDATDHKLDARYINLLRALCLMPRDVRIDLLNKNRLVDLDPDSLIELLADFIGLANSVVASSREFVEYYLVKRCNHDRETASKINMPTLIGALNGIELALSAKGMCAGCAFRAGSAANQSPMTTIDARDAVINSGVPGEKFFCHERLGDGGNPSVLCRGFKEARKQGLIAERLKHLCRPN